MDGGTQALIMSGVALVGGAIGWLGRQYWQHRAIKRQATQDAVTTLEERKTLLEEMLSKADDTNDKNNLITQRDEVNAALVGLQSERLQRTLKTAGFPPEEALITVGLGRLQPREAIQIKEIVEEIRRLPPSTSTHDLLLLGDAYYRLKEYENARQVYSEVIDLNPHEHIAIRRRGAIYIHMGKYEEAVTDFDRSLEIYPDEIIALNDRGVALTDLKKYQESLSNFNRALEIKPDDPTILLNRGITYGHLKKYEEALADYNRSLELRPDYPKALYNIACLLSLQGKPDDALAYLEKAIKGDEKYLEMAKTDKDFDNIRDNPHFKIQIE